MSGLLMFIDFERAFDSMSRDFLLDVLEFFGFGQSFVNWIRVLFNSNTAICNNGFTSEYFSLERGVKQGDPISPYLFILGAEIMSVALRNNENIKGIKVGNDEIKLAQFADDTTVFLKDTHSVKTTLDLLNRFWKISGLKLNIDKTEVLGLGSLKDVDLKQFGIKCSKQVKALGIHFCYDTKVKEDLNFGKLPSQMNKITNMWKQRNLTLLGKVILIQSLLLSKLTYIRRQCCFY